MAVAGIGGYAAVIADLILADRPGAAAPAKLTAVCDPDAGLHPARVDLLRGRGVEVFPSYEAMLADPAVRAVWLPLPIPLHRRFTEQALGAGKAVMVEKPAAATVGEVDAMIAARDRAGLPVLVGFQDVYDATTLPLKRRIMGGEFGRITHATLHACWPRTDGYFGRSDWAGRVRMGGDWVLDSPPNNALAHFVNIVLFLLGPTPESSATPLAVEAELYRAAPIENYDTVSARATLEGGTSFLVLLTHAAATTHHPRIVLHGERGRIVRELDRITIETPDGTRVIARDRSMHAHMLDRFAGLVRGEPDGADHRIAAATLEVARRHTVLVNGVSQAASIVTVPPDAVRGVDQGEGVIQTIPGIEAAFERCAADHRMLHESGFFPFTQPPGGCDLRGYRHFSGPRQAANEPVPS